MSKKFVQLTGLDTAARLTTLTGIPSGTKEILIQPEGQNIRWRDDGTAPTSLIGNLLIVGDSLLYDKNLNDIQIIETQASATVNVTFY